MHDGLELLRSYSVLGMLLPLIIITIQDCFQVLNAYSEISGWVSKTCLIYPVKSVSKMLLLLLLTFSIFSFFGVVCVQLTHSSLGDWEDIFVTHKIGSIKPLHCYFIFPWLPARGGCTIIFSQWFYMCTVPGKLGFCFCYFCAGYCVCKYLNDLRLEDHICLFAHYTISLSSLCRLIWRYSKYKMLVRYILSNVGQRLSQCFQLSFMEWEFDCSVIAQTD